MEGCVGDGAGEVNGFGDGVRVFRVFGVAALDEDDAGTELFGLADLGAGLDFEGLGLVAGGDAAGGVGHSGNNGEGFSAVLRVELLFDGREEAVQVDVEEAEAVGMGIGGHRTCEQLYSLFICLQSRRT